MFSQQSNIGKGFGGGWGAPKTTTTQSTGFGFGSTVASAPATSIFGAPVTAGFGGSSTGFGANSASTEQVNSLNYQFTPFTERGEKGETMYYQCITAQDRFKNLSLEELRLNDYREKARRAAQGGAGGFGQSTGFGQPTSSSFSGFGQTASSGFGQPAQHNNQSVQNSFQNTTSGFGQPARTGFGQTAQSGLGMKPSFGFGQASTTPSPFGQTSTSAFGQTTTPAGFGQTATPNIGGFGQTTTPSIGGFGQTTTATTVGFGQTATPVTSGFAQSTTQASPFGQSKDFGLSQATPPTTSFGFGQTGVSNPFASKVGQATTGFGAQPTTGMFGQQPQQTTGLFGGSQQAATAPSQQAGGNGFATGFGQTQTAFGQTPQGFGQTQQPQQAVGGFGQTQATTGGFGQKPSSTLGGFGQTQSSLGGFGQTQQTNGTGQQAQPATGLFSQPTPASGGFGQTSGAFGQAASAFKFGQPAAASATTGAATSAFSFNKVSSPFNVGQTQPAQAAPGLSTLFPQTSTTGWPSSSTTATTTPQAAQTGFTLPTATPGTTSPFKLWNATPSPAPTAVQMKVTSSPSPLGWNLASLPATPRSAGIQLTTPASPSPPCLALELLPKTPSKPSTGSPSPLRSVHNVETSALAHRRAEEEERVRQSRKQFLERMHREANSGKSTVQTSPKTAPSIVELTTSARLMSVIGAMSTALKPPASFRDHGCDDKVSRLLTSIPESDGYPNKDYYTIPSYKELVRMQKEESSKLKELPKFTIGIRDVGRIDFVKPVDLSAVLDFSCLFSLVVFNRDRWFFADVYPLGIGRTQWTFDRPGNKAKVFDGCTYLQWSEVVSHPDLLPFEKPAAGFGLNVPAEVTLFNVFPKLTNAATCGTLKVPLDMLAPEMEVCVLNYLKRLPRRTFMSYNDFPGMYRYSVTDFSARFHDWIMYTIPSKGDVSKMELAEKQACPAFTVAAPHLGKIEFRGPIDLTTVDMDKLTTIVDMTQNYVSVYGDGPAKVPIGQGLNHPARITLYHRYPSREQIPFGYDWDAYVNGLRQAGKFVSYNRIEGEWVFDVDHF